MKLNVPNQLTVVRLLLAVVFLILLSLYSQRAPQSWKLDVANLIFIVAALTDFLDGYIARKHGLVTPLGRVLDPLADKVLICGAFIMFAGASFVDAEGRNVTGVAGWMVVVIVARELLVTGLRGFNESIGKDFSASLHGKIKMWVQSISAPAVLLIVAHQDTFLAAPLWNYLKLGLVYLTVVVTVLSVFQYLARSRHILEHGA